MIARNKAATVSNPTCKDKRNFIYGRASEDQVRNKSNGVNSNDTNGAPEHITNGYPAESDSLTIAHARSKSAPAINQAGVRIRQQKGEKGRTNDINNEDEDDEVEDDEMDDGDDSDAEECYKKITEGNQHAQPEEPQRIRPDFAKNPNSDNKASTKERSKTPMHLTQFKDQSSQLTNHYNSIENVDGKEFVEIQQHKVKHKGQNGNHVYDVPEGEDYMAIYETIDRKRQEARELKNKSHSMEALETPNASIKGDDDQSSVFDFKTSEQNIDLHKQHEGSVSSSARRRHRSKPHESNKASTKCTSNSFHRTEHKRWSIHEKSVSSNATPNSFQSQPSKKISNTSTGNGTNIISNGTQSNNHPLVRNNPPNVDLSTDLTDGGMASFLKRALRLEGPQLCQRTITIKKTVRESLGMRIGGGIGSNEGDTPIYIANIHPHGCIGKAKNLKVMLFFNINAHQT